MSPCCHHPLEPLSAAEIDRVVSALREAEKVSPTTRFVSVSLHEPDKDQVHGFTGQQRVSRQAFVVLFDNARNECYETVVSADDGALVSWKHIPDVQPTMTIDEQVECEQAVLASEAFRAALERHYGVDDASLVMVDIWSAGNYGAEEDRTLRLGGPCAFCGVILPTMGTFARSKAYGLWSTSTR